MQRPITITCCLGESWILAARDMKHVSTPCGENAHFKCHSTVRACARARAYIGAHTLATALFKKRNPVLFCRSEDKTHHHSALHHVTL